MTERLYYKNQNGWVTEFSVFSDFHVNVSRDVDGLNDVDNKINATTTIGQDGETYVSSTIEARDIHITGHLRATTLDRQVQLRQRLNHALSPKQRGELVYVCGNLRRHIYCYPETAPNYTPGKMPQFVILLRCPNPFWQGETTEEIHIAEWESLMEFDETEGLQLDDIWEIGSRTGELIVNVENEGDVDCGMTIIFEAEGSVTNPLLMDVETLKYVKLNIAMLDGDRIEVTTAYGQKAAVLIRAGTRTSIFRLLDQDTTFLQMQVGENLFRCDADANASNLIARILFSSQYLGV